MDLAARLDSEGLVRVCVNSCTHGAEALFAEVVVQLVFHVGVALGVQHKTSAALQVDGFCPLSAKRNQLLLFILFFGPSSCATLQLLGRFHKEVLDRLQLVSEHRPNEAALASLDAFYERRHGLDPALQHGLALVLCEDINLELHQQVNRIPLSGGNRMEEGRRHRRWRRIERSIDPFGAFRVGHVLEELPQLPNIWFLCQQQLLHRTDLRVGQICWCCCHRRSVIL
mmetsp:Transcript_112381/g.281530  ORF Transcript_112381/g.281530 Transcript_112381/m.281530 type:complete len:227 (-) Transcript_112381:985-1665(-)